ncbi:MAG: LptF/LptG family permease [Planctomycetota bacterium]|jgi:lipopolysaccharide export LptBFGC system permease protein LptF|nr:LptF/LptG family permease [Planctomycetota bacterium]
MANPKFSPGLKTWMPFYLWRIDRYFTLAYLKVLGLIIAGMVVLVTISDAFQHFDDFIIYSRGQDLDTWNTILLFTNYYSAFVPQIIFQYLLPLSLLLAATITATSAYAGPRGNNEYTVLRSVGLSIKRSILPLILPSFFLMLAFQASRDFFLPGMVRQANSIMNRMRNRPNIPVDVSLIYGADFQTVAIGYFSPENQAYNLILEVRDLAKYQRGDINLGDNDFVAYRASQAQLELNADGVYQWRPLLKADRSVFTRFSREQEAWTTPIPTNLTPAMIERQTLGDMVCSWQELFAMLSDNAGARFEIHWRLADQIECVILVMIGLGICMGRMLRTNQASYIQAATVAILTTSCFYGLRMAGRSLWESGTLSPVDAAWYPLGIGVIFLLPIVLWMER